MFKDMMNSLSPNRLSAISRRWLHCWPTITSALRCPDYR